MSTPRSRGRAKNDGVKINSPVDELSSNCMPLSSQPHPSYNQDKSQMSQQNNTTPLLIKIKVPNNIKLTNTANNTNKSMVVEEDTTTSKNKNVRKYKKHKNNIDSAKDDYIEEDVYLTDEDEEKTPTRTKNKRSNRTKLNKTRNVNTRSRPKKVNEEEESLYGDEDLHTQAYYASIAMWKRVEECFDPFTDEDYEFLTYNTPLDSEWFEVPKLGTSWKVQKRSEQYQKEFPKTYFAKVMAAKIDDRSQQPRTPEKKEELEFLENYIHQTLLSLGLLDDISSSQNGTQVSQNGVMISENESSEDDEICVELKKLQEQLREIIEVNRKRKEKLLAMFDEENEWRKRAKEKRERILKEDSHHCQVVKSYTRSKKKKKS